MEERDPPVTRFRVAPAPLLKNTEPPLPMEKPFQFIMPLAVFWFIVIEEPEEAIVPEPKAKEPPVGRTGPAKAGVCPIGIKSIIAVRTAIENIINTAKIKG
jgi:hypothetical protein